MVFTVEQEFIFPLKVSEFAKTTSWFKKGEPFNLMRNIPIEADEIESLMN
jgi:Xaa-Pro aminopeptidase